MANLYVFWQNPESRRWFPVGILSRINGIFQFVYTRGAEKAAGFIPFGRMTDTRKRYQAQELFPLFSNRILSAKRPEFNQFIHWIAAEQTPDDPMIILGRTGGYRATDSIVVYPKPEPNESGEFDLLFLCHGMRYLSKDTIDRVSHLQSGDVLYPMFDVLNPYDENAIALRTDDPPHFIGYVPRFFARELRRCIELTKSEASQVSVVKVNVAAPLQFRLLCRFKSPWPTGFRAWDQSDYQPLTKEHKCEAVDPAAAE